MLQTKALGTDGAVIHSPERCRTIKPATSSVASSVTLP